MNQKENKLSGCYGPHFERDPVIHKEMRWRIATASEVTASKKKVRDGCAPIIPEDEEAASITGVKIVPIDDLDRV